MNNYQHHDKAQELAEHIAGAIFNAPCGLEGLGPVCRIQFKYEANNDAREVPGGGLCFEALARNIKDAIENHELARRVVELESARGEPVGYVLPSGIKQLNKDHPTDIYAPDNPTVPGSYPVWLYTAPPAPAAVPEPLVMSMCASVDYLKGWNDCRNKMLAAAPQPKEAGE